MMRLGAIDRHLDFLGLVHTEVNLVTSEYADHVSSRLDKM